MITSARTEHALLETLVYGKARDWEKHELGTTTRFVKSLVTPDPLMKAQVAERYDAMGFIPLFFKEHGREFVALEDVKQASHYKSIEQAFMEQILSKVGL